MTERSFVTVANGDISLEVAVQGSGPLMLCVHGWPEGWYSWRHQMDHFADRFTVAAMSVRGYGNSSNPTDIESYALRELAGDAAAVIDELGGGSAVVLGHDWGAPIAWNTARLHPEKVSAVCGLSVPYIPTGPDNSLDLWRERYTSQGKFFYQVYFDDNRGGAEEELGADHARSLRMIYFGASGDRPGEDGLTQDKPADAKMLDGLVDPDPFPDWCTPEDFEVYAAGFKTSGWHGPLNRYRAQGLDAADIGQLSNPNLAQPAAFIGGSLDPVRNFAPGMDLFEFAGVACDDFRGTTVIEGAGHWVQQEAPAETNAALDEFVGGL
ncbi:MAG: alpha/beta hydrolase [Actinomycetota bacterium]